MSAELVWRWLEAGELDLPSPGSGHTGKRWSKLAALTEHDVVAGRLAEAHTDAAAILEELDGPAPERGQLWGVWAAEARDAVVVARDGEDGAQLDGNEGVVLGCGVVHARTRHRPARRQQPRTVCRRSPTARGDPADPQLAQRGHARQRHPVGPVHRCVRP